MMSAAALGDSPLIAGLNPSQREAVLATDGPVLILAGAGSGKTRVITHRVAHLILDRQVPSEAILAVTFTNKAADEMRARVAALLPGQAVDCWISTFHSLALRLLRMHSRAANLSPGFLVYDAEDQLSAVRAALRKLSLSEKQHPPRRLLARISARKNSLLGPSAAPEWEPGAAETLAPEPRDESLVETVGQAYRAILDAASALDFDDLLLRTAELLERNSELRERYRRRFRYLLVDEYQDTNRVQYALVRLLSEPSGNLTVVGDEDQSIYSWRGADLGNILAFEQDFPGARILRLEDNYRSVQVILDTASALVRHNQRRIGKTLRSVRQGGEPVRLHTADDEYQEAAWVVARLAERRDRAAVLYRMNFQSRLLEEALLRRGIRYQVVGGVGFYARKEIKDALCYLRVLANPRDNLALRRILNVPPRCLGARALAEIEGLASRHGWSFWDALGAVLEGETLPARALRPLSGFRDLILGLAAAAAGLSVKDLLSQTLELSGYARFLGADNDRDGQERLENLAELLNAAEDYDSRVPDPSLAGFLDRTSLLSEADLIPDEAPVVLMTLHAAKGLEFDTISIVGLEEGLLPHARSLGDAPALEEERRLCYVGMTRAMSRLLLSHARSRQVFGVRRLATPSRFLSEIPRGSLWLTGGLESGWALETEAHSPPPPASRTHHAADGFRTGTRVRHPLFGVGTVLRSDGSGEDLKLTVTFPGLGAKRLVARFAGLVPA